VTIKDIGTKLAKDRNHVPKFVANSKKKLLVVAKLRYPKYCLYDFVQIVLKREAVKQMPIWIRTRSKM
jgi:hypothetical protein